MENIIGTKTYRDILGYTKTYGEHNRYQNMVNIIGTKTYGEHNRYHNIWRTH